MQNDRQITISSAGSRKAIKWQTQQIYWSEFVTKLSAPSRSPEKLSEYLRLPKAKQDDLKDVGGFVGGALSNGLRRANSVLGRDLITLDLDSIPVGETVNVLQRVSSLGCSYAVYSTRKHEAYKPRLRIIVPLARTCSADEYEPIARKLASFIGIEMCDPSTFEVHRLMYWPSCCADSEYVFRFADKPLLDVDGMLALYESWQDFSSWPQVPGVSDIHKKLLEKQADPEGKTGVVGAFCRVFDIYRVLDELIPGVYDPCDTGDGRYTYLGGSTTGGAVIYEGGKFLYSHHATDPAGGKLCNAFDLVRIHLYGKMDDEAKPETPINKLPSYIAMCRYAAGNGEVSSLLNKENYEMATSEFDVAGIEDADPNWVTKLQLSPTTGRPEKTIDNILIILENDPLLKGKMYLDSFMHQYRVKGALPWNPMEELRSWGNTDDAGLRCYLEKVHNMTGKDKILDALSLSMEKHAINAPQNYLEALEWDGVKRLDTLLTDYLGADDTVYTRAVIRKALAAAVARVIIPGIKFDPMTILTGPQGIGKTTFLRTLGGEWFSNSLTTFEGKEAYEIIQGAWIVEIGELQAFSKSEGNSIKQFLSKQEDKYRVAYGHRAETFPRTCVFFGTTNANSFLKDDTGERRFWPVIVGTRAAKKDVFTQLEAERDQIWAEARVVWESGEKLILIGVEETESKLMQELHKESNPKVGVIREFLERLLPEDWKKRDLAARRVYWGGEYECVTVATVERERVCAAEIWCEAFNGDLKFMKRTDTLEINKILESFTDWVPTPSPYRCAFYGPQRGFQSKQSLLQSPEIP